MKKFILSAAILCGILSTATAQTTETGATDAIKPVGGDVTLEANVNIFNGGVSFSNSLQQIRFRSLRSEKFAFRLGANVRYNADAPAPDVEATSIEVSIAPGIEKHFTGTDRLSPYIGAELLVGFRTAKAEDNSDANMDVNEINGAWNSSGANRGYFMVGVGGVAGFDFYVAKHLYVGYELGFEVVSKNLSEVQSVKDPSFGEEIKTTHFKSESSLSIGPNVRNGIRVGFVF